MSDKDYKEALEKLNIEYKKIKNSREYLLGKKILKFRYYIKYFMFTALVKKIKNTKKRKKVFMKDNYANEKIFKDNEKGQIKEIDFNEKIVIYTVNIGKYDRLIQPLIKNENVDFILVSDKKPNDLGQWKWIDANKYIPSSNLSNVKKARFIKTHPHLIFNKYKYSIFIDGNIRCITDITEFIPKINKKTKIAIHPHPYRDCIYKEIESCKTTGKGNYNVMKKQLEEYEKEGMPKEFGLFETNVFIREHNDLNCIKIMDDWWNEINIKSERDQLSFTYVLWKNGYNANDIGVIYGSILDNPSVQVVDHLEIYEKEEKNERKN